MISSYDNNDKYRDIDEVEKTKSISVTDIIDTITAILLIVSSNTLYGRIGKASQLIRLSILFLELFVIASHWCRKGLSKQTIWKWLLWCLAFIVSYVATCFAYGVSGGLGNLCFFAIAMLSPLYVYVMIRMGRWRAVCRKFSLIMIALAIFSMILWIFGSLLGIIKSNCTIETNWTPMGNTIRLNGYYHLLYEYQYRITLGKSIVRNTGIFVEGPMYSFSLCVAAMFVWLYENRSFRQIALPVLFATIISTQSTTGILFILVFICLNIINTNDRKSAIRILLIPIVIIVVVLSIYMVSSEKLQSGIASTRVDDFIAGYNAWLHSPIFGNGFDLSSFIHTYTSGFRANDLGFSNSIMAVLATGGLLFAIPYLLGFAGFFISNNMAKRFAGVLYLLIWTITIVYRLPLAMILLGWGYCSQLDDDDYESRAETSR